MPFNSFEWISLLVSFGLQSYCFVRFKQHKSFRLLLGVMCLLDLSAIATHGWPVLYWDQLWIGRIVVICLSLWATADIACYPDKPKLSLRVPVAFAALLAIPYWPLRPEASSGEMEMYRFFGLCLAMLILVLHIVFLIGTKARINLHLILLVALAAEATGAAAVILYGWQPRYQPFCWWLGLGALAAVTTDPNAVRILPLLPQGQPLGAQDRSAGNEGICLRLPLPARFPHSRVFERWQR